VIEKYMRAFWSCTFKWNLTRTLACPRSALSTVLDIDCASTLGSVHSGEAVFCPRTPDFGCSMIGGLAGMEPRCDSEERQFSAHVSFKTQLEGRTQDLPLAVSRSDNTFNAH
jgi:hypothetical protein